MPRKLIAHRESLSDRPARDNCDEQRLARRGIAASTIRLGTRTLRSAPAVPYFREGLHETYQVFPCDDVAHTVLLQA